MQIRQISDLIEHQTKFGLMLIEQSRVIYLMLVIVLV